MPQRLTLGAIVLVLSVHVFVSIDVIVVVVVEVVVLRGRTVSERALSVASSRYRNRARSSPHRRRPDE
jgi:hypothetical protein